MAQSSSNDDARPQEPATDTSAEQTEPAPLELNDRVAALEAQVYQLTEKVDRLLHGPTPMAWPSEPTRQASERPDSEPRRKGLRVENWIDRLGIALLLLGVGFLLKYTYDQGLLVVQVRVALGFAVGVALLVVGLIVRRRNHRLAAIMLGGSIAVFYGMIFASYQLFGLLRYGGAFGAMAVVTAVAFVLATTHRQAVLANVGALGGLATPFMLHTATVSSGTLGVYVAIVLLGTTAVYLARGWTSLLLTSSVGGWLVVGFATFEALPPETTGPLELALTHVGIAAALLATGVAPLVKSLQAEQADGDEANGLILGLTVAAPLAATLFSHHLVAPGPIVTFSALAVLGLAYGAASRAVNARGSETEAGALLVAGGGLIVLGATLALEGPVVPLALAAGSVGLHTLARRAERPDLRAAADLIVGALVVWAALVLLREPAAQPFLNADAVQLLATSTALFAAGYGRPEPGLRLLGHQLANATLLATVLHQLNATPGQEPVVTALWGADALVLLAIGLARHNRSAQLVGLVAILAASAKLLIFDMDTVNPMWRVAIFMAIGAALLGMSYLVPGSEEPSETDRSTR